MSYSSKRQRPAATGRQGTSQQSSVDHSITSLNPASSLLGRLDGVVQTSKGWRARCPSHGGRSASLAIAQGGNGTLLVHCFAGCQVHEVLGAVGLHVGDLFIHRDLMSMSPAERKHLRQMALLPKWRAAHEVLVHAASVTLVAANQLLEGSPLDAEGLAALRVACLQIFDAQEVLRDH
ncbi:hypothetical protein AB4076_01395 [Dyella sp. 2RAF44]|uniref:hypothetical protein n=1 Tax=Dyella sp. 2RAF44 TaxID=3233000 RepID=UPI003F915FF9